MKERRKTVLLSLAGSLLTAAALFLPAISGYIPGERASCLLSFRMYALAEVSPWAWGMIFLPLWLLASAFLSLPGRARVLMTAAACAVHFPALCVGVEAAKRFLLDNGAVHTRYSPALGASCAVILLILAASLAVPDRPEFSRWLPPCT